LLARELLARREGRYRGASGTRRRPRLAETREGPGRRIVRVWPQNGTPDSPQQ
jgi:hypothetical protein